MAATFLPRQYFPSRWKACIIAQKIAAHCMQQLHMKARHYSDCSLHSILDTKVNLKS